jgi:hypothetical protein
MDEGCKNGGEDLLNTCWVSPAPTLDYFAVQNNVAFALNDGNRHEKSETE